MYGDDCASNIKFKKIHSPILIANVSEMIALTPKRKMVLCEIRSSTCIQFMKSMNPNKMTLHRSGARKKKTIFAASTRHTAPHDECSTRLHSFNSQPPDTQKPKINSSACNQHHHRNVCIWINFSRVYRPPQPHIVAWRAQCVTRPPAGARERERNRQLKNIRH